MPKLVNAIKEYFLGTETRRFYRVQRAFYREYELNPQKFSQCKLWSMADEIVMLGLSKWVPVILDILAVGQYFFTKNSYLTYGNLIIAEAMRAAGSVTLYRRRKDGESLIKSRRDFLESPERIERRLTDLTDDSDDEGEEWKRQ